MKPKLPATADLAGSVHQARRRYRKRLALCQENFSEDAVHELRIETRRILALLHLLKTLGVAALDKTARSFKKRLNVFDDLRDTQVQLRLLKPLWREFPEAEALQAFLTRREARLVSRLAYRIQATKAARLNRRLKDLEETLAAARPVSTGRAGTALRAMFRRVVALRRQAGPDDAGTLHRLRVAFKRFRYVSELLRPLHPEFTVQRLERMKAYQASAGDIQDLEVLLARLAQVVRDRKINPAALRNLRHALLQRRLEAIRSFMVRIDELFEFEPVAQSRVSHSGGARLPTSPAREDARPTKTPDRTAGRRRPRGTGAPLL